MKVKYLSSKVMLVGSALLATPAISIGLLVQPRRHEAPQDSPPRAPIVQRADAPVTDDPMIIRVIVIRSPSGRLDGR